MVLKLTANGCENNDKGREKTDFPVALRSTGSVAALHFTHGHSHHFQGFFDSVYINDSFGIKRQSGMIKCLNIN